MIFVVIKILIFLKECILLNEGKVVLINIIKYARNLINIEKCSNRFYNRIDIVVNFEDNININIIEQIILGSVMNNKTFKKKNISECKYNRNPINLHRIDYPETPTDMVAFYFFI